MTPFCLSNIPYVEVRMNSRAAQLTVNGAQIVSMMARFALGASFLSAVADRFWFMGTIWSKERILGRFCSFRGIHGRGVVSLAQFIDGVVCMGSYHRGDTLGDLAHRGLQNTNGVCSLRFPPSVICYGYSHGSWHQDAIRLFGLLGGCSSILTGVLGA